MNISYGLKYCDERVCMSVCLSVCKLSAGISQQEGQHPLTGQRAACDRQTDGIAVASTALAMRALRRAVKTTVETSEIFCTCYLWPWLGPPLTTVQYIM